MQKKLSYRKLVYAAYGFLILLSLSWVVAGFYAGGGINYNALIMLVIFTIQAYYNHRIANLVVGIIVLLISIFGTLHFVAWGGKAGFDPFIYGMVGAGILSIAASIILMFSYLKMSFEGKDLI